MRKLRVPAVLIVGVVSIASSVASCKDDEECVVRCVPARFDAGVTDAGTDAASCSTVEPDLHDECPVGCMPQFDHCFT
jgi:hypothetical protein